MSYKSPTHKQIKAVELLTANASEGISKAEILRIAGYSESTQRQPSRVFESEQVQALMAKAEAVGITDDLLIKKIKEAIESPDLKTAIDSVFKWIRLKYPELNPFANRNHFAQNNTQVNIYGVEQGAYQFLANKTGLTIDEIKKRLDITD